MKVFLIPALAIGLAACQSTGAAKNNVTATELEQVEWQMVSLYGQTIASEQTPVLFLDGERVGGVTTCNNYFGRLALTQNAIEIEPMGMTEKYCQDAMETEQAIFNSFAKVSQWQSDGKVLKLLSSSGDVVSTWQQPAE